MCINDIYMCRDSSRINCTLACSTLGYIPCKNYADKQICLKLFEKYPQLNKNYLNFNKYKDYLKYDDSNSIEYFNNSFLIISIGLLLIIILTSILVLIAIIYKKRILLKTKFNRTNINASNDYDADPPPTYQEAKQFPKVSITNNNYSHIYEDINDQTRMDTNKDLNSINHEIT